MLSGIQERRLDTRRLVEISIEGNFMEDRGRSQGNGGSYAYVSSHNQFEILDISEPNNIVLLSTYYAEIGRMIDIKVTLDNNWVLVNHELTNSDLDPFPDDDATGWPTALTSSTCPTKRADRHAEWNNPPAGSTTKTCTLTATGKMRHSSTLRKSATCSSTVPTLTLRWWKVIPCNLQGHAGVLRPARI